jgi:hypothetical protein
MYCLRWRTLSRYNSDGKERMKEVEDKKIREVFMWQQKKTINERKY